MQQNRKQQRLVVKSDRGLYHRGHAVNGEIPEGWPDSALDHIWGCPGCGSHNDSRHMSCRSCATLKWGVAP